MAHNIKRKVLIVNPNSDPGMAEMIWIAAAQMQAADAGRDQLRTLSGRGFCRHKRHVQTIGQRNTP